MSIKPPECRDLFATPISSDDYSRPDLSNIFVIISPDPQNVIIQFFQITHYLRQSRTKLMPRHPCTLM
ncbi:hypothetical protein BHS04_21070 [Myxococcus xanthus]|nr:hypothetical protein BHS04_21070 [Myxococcus xanthus]